MNIFKKGPDNSDRFGERFTRYGETWELVAQNDLNVPYFVKVVRGKPQKTRYAGEGLTSLLR